MTDRALRFRSPELVAEILGRVYDSDDPVPWDEIVAELGERVAWKTVENTLYELVQFGALHRIGKPADRRRRDTRALKPTPLGRAWLDREILELPGSSSASSDEDREPEPPT